jgi:signal transduction histidine kinase/HAMP domain-containing protein
MAQQAIDSARPPTSLQSPQRSGPVLGMRGGLGRTLLIAFLLLAIVPLSLLAILTNSQIQRNTGQRILTSLETMVTLKAAHVVEWVSSYERELNLLTAGLDSLSPPGQSLANDLSVMLATLQSADPTWVALMVMDRNSGELVASSETDAAVLQTVRQSLIDNRQLVIAPPLGMDDGSVAEAHGPLLLAIPHTYGDWQLVGVLHGQALQQIITDSDNPEEGIATSLITGDGFMVSRQGLTRLSEDEKKTLTQDVLQALQGHSGSGSYADAEGDLSYSAYRWNPELQVALLARQPQTLALATGDALTAVVVGAALAVALITAAIAAMVTRRVTRPIVQLTETAAWMARGDLNQQVAITRRDEIGVLARAFNRMAAELRTLYANLEAKVAQRTQQLEAANQKASYHAMQLTISAEAARIISSIRDLDVLLSTVVELIGNAFELHHASIYLVDDSGEWIVWQAGSNKNGPAPAERREAVGGTSLVGQVAVDGRRQVARASVPERDPAAPQPTTEAAAMHPPVRYEMAVPLRARGQILGVIDLLSSRPNDFDDNDQMVYQSLADQISIAIENARAYAVERETVEKLRELDRIQSQFLTNMSHALRTPLNSIIGFSRVMLKELEGPLNDLQRTDLAAIHESGRQLLGLINDMLDLSQLDLGTAPLTITEVDLAEIIEGVMATSRALARGKPVQLYEEVPADLPHLRTDGQRVRQVILALVSNAVKFTNEGSIWLRITDDDGRVTISVSDTGVGIPPAERARIFSDTPYDETDEGGKMPGFGLAISKRVVEKLGGQIWLESKEGSGSTFTFTLPITPGGLETA